MTMGCTVGNSLAAFALFLCMGLWYPILAEDAQGMESVTAIGALGAKANITCVVIGQNMTIEWQFSGKPIKSTDRINITSSQGQLSTVDNDGASDKTSISTIIISNVTRADAGVYTCNSSLKNVTKSETLDLRFPTKLVDNDTVVYNERSVDHRNIIMECTFQVYENLPVKWWKMINESLNELLLEDMNTTRINDKEIKSIYTFPINTFAENGTYYCETDEFAAKRTMHVKVYAPAEIDVLNVVPVNTTQIFLNWTVKTFNSDIISYTLWYRNSTVQNLQMYVVRIDPKNTSFVMNNLEKSTEYWIQLSVNISEYLTELSYSKIKGPVKTLDKDPTFVPNITINGYSMTSVTIGWAAPPKEIAHLIHSYELKATKKRTKELRNAYYLRDGKDLPYMFDNLEPYNTYIFQVQACSEYTSICGPWSLEMEAATMDGIPKEPTHVLATCGTSSLNITWGPPEKANAEIKGYTMEIIGRASYNDSYGLPRNATWGPLSKFMTNSSFSVSMAVQPWTTYTVHVSAMTRTRRRGGVANSSCTTLPAPPDAPPRLQWRKIFVKDKYMFKLNLSRVSERNGPICCYRVYVVRLPVHMGLQKLSPANVPVTDYDEVHASDEPTNVGAYITDVFSNENFPRDSELLLGDDKRWFNRSEPRLNMKECLQCLRKPKYNEPPPPTTTTTTAVPTTELDSLLMDDVATEDPTNTIERDKRSLDDYYSRNPTMMDKRTDDSARVVVKDGPLNPNCNYTLFVEIITGMTDEDVIYSDWIPVLMPAPSPSVPVPASTLEIALQITCAVAAVILLLMIIFCIMQTRRSRKMPPHAHLEMGTIPAIIRHVVGGFCGRQQLTTIAPPDKPPIAKEDLPEAYAERQADSDYEFQKEFELLQMLPDYFPDRTTHASEARENQPKNRYPDIKAYDQTRVKLSQIDGITGSDYINANYVLGYQERKQFVCAQGPTDTTVNDFWRMIWEGGLELIVMLTNLEEYSKVKCSKYWPEERSARAFGNITVQHVGEKRYSDYIVRELKITKQAINSDGHPIVENNGIAKRNGDIKECEGGASPRDSQQEPARLVRQYHFLMWKDFAAPEQPHSILKFIKRVNEAWSSMVGRPIVVHCSAGVGRTGTLVALDCLLEELRETGQVTVFNTVAELRRQRNFLVQSLKQYVFVYRALVEYAHYGDTEIPAGRLKPTVDQLRNTPEDADKCLMEIEFEKIMNSPVSEPLKSCAAGAGEDLRSRNRSDEFLPYDRNRVILTPMPTREYSTYINASFIEAYDNTEGFIITQDPLPNTIMDFWRMVSEHNVTTIVMLSELGDGKCPRYWDDGTINYEHISVQYEESESCPYYTRRQFTVTNEKSGEQSQVRQLQYQGWPTAPGHVPEVTRGLAELADAAAPAQPPPPPTGPAGTMLVHCLFGTERAPLFVALCTLVRQLRGERRVDVSGVARAVRHQRAGTIDTFLQYEFLYRAILNYAELHNLLEDS